MTDELCIDVLSAKKGNIGHLILNRPKALNALSLEMIQNIHQTLLDWEKDNTINAVLITSNGDRAFCAGGDIRALYEFHHAHPNEDNPYFATEYRMNQTIFHYTKPYIAFLDGITMGGGVGISILGSHPIACENTRFAMPETGIGFFPDIGGGYFLNQCPNQFGWYLGLTGNIISANDLLETNLVKHYIPSEKFPDFLDALQSKDLTQKACIDDTLTLFHETQPQGELYHQKACIKSCFDAPNLETVFERLECNNTDWTNRQLNTLNSRSPLSLKVTFEMLKRCQNLNFDAIMSMNLTLSHHFVAGHDFMEGIRAAVIDKDRRPNWSYTTIDAVDHDTVMRFFE